jgi:hypothetical protein
MTFGVSPAAEVRKDGGVGLGNPDSGTGGVRARGQPSSKSDCGGFDKMSIRSYYMRETLTTQSPGSPKPGASVRRRSAPDRWGCQ